MDIRSRSSPPESAAAYEARARAESDARARQEQDRRTRQAEQEAQDRIQLARRNADETTQEIERRSEAQRSDGNARIEAEREHIQQQLEQTKAQGYNQLRELKRRQDAELAIARQDGERTQEEVEGLYRQEIEDTTRKSSKAAREAYLKNLKDLEQMDELAKAQRKAYEEVHSSEMQNLHRMQEDARSSELTRSRSQTEELRKKVEDARASAENKFRDQFAQTIGQHETILNRLNQNTSSELESLRAEGARKLTAYESRQEDPFYRMVNLDAELHDSGDAFVLRARVPAHEQENVKASIQGRQIVVTGSRRAQDQVELGEGRARSTSSYQTFREVFPIDWPVDAGSMLRESKGDELVFTFPKRAGMIDPENGKKKSLEHELYSKQRAPRPDFPEGLITPAPPYKGSPIS